VELIVAVWLIVRLGLVQMEDEPTTELLDRNGWTLDEALDDFTRKTHATLIGLGKMPLVWQEMVSTHNRDG
jgi:hexosaminidase